MLLYKTEENFGCENHYFVGVLHQVLQQIPTYGLGDSPPHPPMTVMVAAELQKRKGVQNWVTVLSLDKLVILYLSAGKVLCDSVTRSVT